MHCSTGERCQPCSEAAPCAGACIVAICMHAVRTAVRLQVLLTHPSRLRALPTPQPRTSVSHTWNLTAAMGSKGSKTSGLKLGQFRC